MIATRLGLVLVLLAVQGCREERVPGAELQVLAERTAVSKAKKPMDVVPYDDALVWHEYEVKKVWFGECKADKIRVAHWSVAGAKEVPVDEKVGGKLALSLRPFETNSALQEVAQSDDLAFDADVPRFIDLGQTLRVESTPKSLRLDYSGLFSEQMTLYWKLRGQLRLVAMGNSVVTKGIDTRQFFPPENERTPVALNLAPAGANNTLQCLIVREYVLPLPKLEWVVWGVSPRAFNAEREDTMKLEVFLASPGWNYDQENESKLWPVAAGTPVVKVEELAQMKDSKFDPWGWEGRDRLGGDEESRLALIKKEFKEPDFSWEEDRWREFVETVRALNAKGVKVLLVGLPMHPIVKETSAADPDWTSHEGMAQLVKRLEGLDQELSRSWYRDYNLAGHHDFTPEEFYDADHMNRAGSVKLTQRIVAWMATCEGR